MTEIDQPTPVADPTPSETASSAPPTETLSDPLVDPLAEADGDVQLSGARGAGGGMGLA